VKKKVRWTSIAVEDLSNMKEKIAEDNVSAAQKMIQTIRKKVERLSHFPESGRIVPEFGSPVLREIIIPPYRVVYRIVGKEVHIIRVWHSKQEIK
jgi:addiction module RelE/StbE family toxin